MEKTSSQKVKNGIEIAVICLFFGVTLLLNLLKPTPFADDFYNRTVMGLCEQLSGATAGIFLIRRLRLRLFCKVENWWCLLPCLLVAVDNFQFSAFFQGKMELVRTKPTDFLLFFLYCLSVGLFEELIFRGVLFALLIEYLPKTKQGLWGAYLASSLLFGVAHLLNGLSGASFLQAGYSILTGGLFAYCLIKTKNIFCCAVVHGTYNFCGLLFDTQGLGGGVTFDLGTVLTMATVGVAVGCLVLYQVWKYTDEERALLYARLGLENEGE